MKFRTPDNLVAKVAAEILRRSQVHLEADHLRELDLHAGNSQQSRNMLRIELDQEIHVAVRAEIVA